MLTIFSVYMIRVQIARERVQHDSSGNVFFFMLSTKKLSMQKDSNTLALKNKQQPSHK